MYELEAHVSNAGNNNVTRFCFSFVRILNICNKQANVVLTWEEDVLEVMVTIQLDVDP